MVSRKIILRYAVLETADAYLVRSVVIIVPGGLEVVQSSPTFDVDRARSGLAYAALFWTYGGICWHISYMAYAAYASFERGLAYPSYWQYAAAYLAYAA
jgi:hypothetical protein